MSHQARNTPKNKLTILGSGTSTGIPIIACPCQVCASDNPLDKRTRMSILLQTASQHNILVDTSPDMRHQMLRENITHLDAVIITHAHADHIHGMDDLRAFTYGRTEPLKVYTNKATAIALKSKFDYIFEPHKVYKDGKTLGGEVAKLEIIELTSGTSHRICGEDFYIEELPHGNIQTISFIHQSFAYLTDCAEIPTPYLQKLSEHKLSLMLLDCAAQKPHKTHLHYDQSLIYATQINAKRTGLIHISHAFSHNQLNSQFAQDMSDSIEAFVTYDSQKLHY